MLKIYPSFAFLFKIDHAHDVQKTDVTDLGNMQIELTSGNGSLAMGG